MTKYESSPEMPELPPESEAAAAQLTPEVTLPPVLFGRPIEGMSRRAVPTERSVNVRERLDTEGFTQALLAEQRRAAYPSAATEQYQTREQIAASITDVFATYAPYADVVSIRDAYGEVVARHASIDLEHMVNGRRVAVKVSDDGRIGVTLPDAPDTIAAAAPLPSEHMQELEYSYRQDKVLCFDERNGDAVTIGSNEAALVAGLVQAARPPQCSLDDVFAMHRTTAEIQADTVRSLEQARFDVSDEISTTLDRTETFMRSVINFVQDGGQPTAFGASRTMQYASDDTQVTITAELYSNERATLPYIQIVERHMATGDELLTAIERGRIDGTGPLLFERSLMLGVTLVPYGDDEGTLMLADGTYQARVFDESLPSSAPYRQAILDHDILLPTAENMRQLRAYLLQDHG